MIKIRNITLTAIIGTMGALLFAFLHIPMPWLLGPLLTILLLQLTTPLPLTWHKYLRNLGLVLAGYSIGRAFTPDAVQDITRYFPLMVILNICYIVMFIFISWLIVKRTNVDTLSAATSVVPGGMSQIVVYAEEQGSENITMITFYQVLRVLCILSIVPLLVTRQPQHVTTSVEVRYSPLLLLFILMAIIAGFIATKCKIPTGYLLGPVLLFIGLQLANISIPAIPVSTLHVAQIVIGIYIGLLLKKKDLHLSKKVLFYAFVSAFIYLGAAYLLAIVVMQWYPLDFKTSFLSIIPGGLDQMGLIAASVNADSAIVTSFQLFRVLVISFLIIPMIKRFIRRGAV